MIYDPYLFIFFIPIVIGLLILVVISSILSNGNEREDIIGMSGVTISYVDDKIGGVVSVGNRSISAKTYKGTIVGNMTVLVVEFCEEENIYKIELYS